MTTQIDASKILERITEAAESSPADVRFIRTMQIGDVARQGDVYCMRVADDVGRGKETAERQLAPGTTKGSRHVVVGEVRVFEPARRGEQVGPIVVAEQRFVVEHPEHAHFSLPAGTYQVGYQLDYQTRRRVAD